ncbi:MAG: PAS domain-containing protein, partial [Mycobacterium sp.]
LLGFEDHEISTRPDDWGSRVHSADLPIVAAATKACLDGHTDVYEVTHRMWHKDGSVRWMLSRGSAIRAADGTLRRMVGTKVDITQRRQAEEVVAESRAVLRRRNEKIEELAGLLNESQEGERARVARDLHDDLRSPPTDRPAVDYPQPPQAPPWRDPSRG